MKKRIAKILGVGLIVLVMSLLVVPAMMASAAKPGGNQEEVNGVLASAADYHLGTQLPDGTWSWVIGGSTGAVNTIGISATGLLAAYERTKDSDYLDGAIAAGNTLITRYDSVATERPYSQDVEFLVRLAADSGNSFYTTRAVVYYARVMAAFDAQQIVNRYVTFRGSLAGWDLASQIRAASATGNYDYAKDMADELIARSDDWVNIPYPGTTDWNCTIVSYASLVWAFRDLGDDSFDTYTGEIREALLEAQESNGSWDGGDYQTTAYAILGLARPRTPILSQAVGNAWAFLRETRTDDAGWSYPPEYGEINSEVITALGSLRLNEGKHFGFTDPNPDKGNDTGRHPLDPVTP